MAIIIYLCKMPLMRINNIFEGGRLAITVIAIILVALGGMVYLVIMILLGGIKKKDLDMLSPRLFSLLPKFLRKNMKSHQRKRQIIIMHSVRRQIISVRIVLQRMKNG